MTREMGDGKRWEVKVTSKGQITLPKEAKGLMMIREGQRLEVTLQDSSLILRHRDELPESEKVRMQARQELWSMGYDPDAPHPELDHSAVRKMMPKLPVNLAELVRAQREGKDEP